MVFYKKSYSQPKVCNHRNDLTKDWYVFFSYKCEGKTYRLKRREGVNRIPDLEERIAAIMALAESIKYDLKHGWNPLADRKREIDYNPFLYTAGSPYKKPVKRINKTKQEIYNYFLNK
ncbi:MAG: Phage integrase family protein [Segetibacter sp.]|nr:Phage integrase family protein [Segetibacter sp.]